MTPKSSRRTFEHEAGGRYTGWNECYDYIIIKYLMWTRAGTPYTITITRMNSHEYKRSERKVLRIDQILCKAEPNQQWSANDSLKNIIEHICWDLPTAECAGLGKRVCLPRTSTQCIHFLLRKDCYIHFSYRQNSWNRIFFLMINAIMKHLVHITYAIGLHWYSECGRFSKLFAHPSYGEVIRIHKSSNQIEINLILRI